MFVKFHLEELFENSVLGLDQCIYGTYHFLHLMNCSKRGSTCTPSLQTEHKFEDTWVAYANLNTDEIIDVKPKIGKQIKELKKLNIDKEQNDTVLETIQNILKKQFNDTSNEYKPD